jgi:dephospho-CoA kinase
VIRRQDRRIEEIAAADPDAVVVVEAAILIEEGAHRRLDKLVLVTCSEEQQVERAFRRGGVTREEALARIRRQLPLEEKRGYADYVIDNSGSEDATLRQVEEVYNRLQSLS